MAALRGTPRLPPAMTDRVPAAGETTPAPRFSVAALAATAALLTACLWIVSRVFLGLDFTDEMQYYGEIASLTEAGRFFQVDWFMQQLGYIFLLPAFKLHAWLFPDQSYLILFGRLVLLGGYALVGLVFWRTTTQPGQFSITHRLVGLAVLLVSIPFQIFGPSYNSMAFLLVVAGLCLALRRRSLPFRRYAVLMAALLTVLTFVYPTAGVTAIALVTGDAAARLGARAAATLLGLTAAGGALVTAVIVALHGLDFFHDVVVALQFSGTFGVAYILREPDQLLALAALVATTGLFLARLRRPDDLLSPPARVETSPVRWGVITLLALGGGIGWLVGAVTRGGFVWTAMLTLLVMVLGRVIPPGSDRDAGSLLRRVAIAAVFGTAAAVLLLNAPRVTPAYYATHLYVMLMLVLAAVARPADGPLRDVAIAGTVLGAVFALTSGNRLHSFGLAAAATLPFFALFAARRFEQAFAGSTARLVGPLATAAIVALLLANNALKPFREDLGWRGFEFAPAVPAFSGIAMSPTKIRAIRAFTALVGRESLAGKRVFVAGPHPWVYFATRARPATPMFFLHRSGPPEVYEWLAARLDASAPPDAVFVASIMPPPLTNRVLKWHAGGYAARVIRLPDDLVSAYQAQTLMDLGGKVILFTRQGPAP